ncbi:hypothetical protein [Mangrovicoccus ximenensis]|uniref:hypothetical protein n=1 Tax=Mangrovicoccus ximenensis TaxID=1911570 RepID=UPI0011AEA0B7|nr:hypothetical protein [Mangrovicoccus ximenensis]
MAGLVSAADALVRLPLSAPGSCARASGEKSFWSLQSEGAAAGQYCHINQGNYPFGLFAIPNLVRAM